jgi:hypothetical protein
MSQDPHSQFDSAVLDMIEHSPIGAVPMTPSYQDALKRLYAAHQIYGDADHKGGHVTARSLGRVPSFHASNLAELVAGRIGPEALESNPSIFTRYVASLPAALRPRAEGFQERVVGRPSHHRVKHLGAEKLTAVHDLTHTLFLIPGTGPHPGLPGNYLYGSLLQAGTVAQPGPWAVQVHDADDGVAVINTPEMAEALAKLQELLASAPFTLHELGDLGFSLP